MTTPADRPTVPDPDAANALHQLLAARGLVRYELFGVVGEGREMPNGLEEESGYALLPDGRVFFFWTGWDAERRAPILKYWDEATPGPDWTDDQEYVRARERLGVGAASE